MPRPAKPTWIAPRPGHGGGYWITRAFGAFSETTGRRKGVTNREIGPPTGRDGPANRLAAQRWVDELAAGERAAERRGDNPTVGDLAEAYCEWSAAHGREPRTVEGHAGRLSWFCARRPGGGVPIKERTAAELRPADLARVIEAMQRDGRAPTYINSIVLSVQAMLNWATRPVPGRVPERILPENPFRGVERPRNPAPPKRYCGKDARRAFMRFAYRRVRGHRRDGAHRRFDRLFVQLLRFCEATGCRPDEACRLEWAHVDWEGRRATLKGKSTHATGRQRVVPLPVPTLGMLRRIARLEGGHARFVFTHVARPKGGGTGGGWDEGNRAGVPWTVNALGHKVAAWRDDAIDDLRAKALKEGAPTDDLPIKAEGPAALTMYAFRRDMGADVLRLTKSHAASAEVLGHSAAVNERHYSSFADDYAVDLADEVMKRRRDKPT